MLLYLKRTIRSDFLPPNNVAGLFGLYLLILKGPLLARYCPVASIQWNSEP